MAIQTIKTNQNARTHTHKQTPKDIGFFSGDFDEPTGVDDAVINRYFEVYYPAAVRRARI